VEISNGNLLVRIRQRTDSVGGVYWNREVREMAAGQSLINRILFATDFSTCARHAEEYVAFLSKAYGILPGPCGEEFHNSFRSAAGGVKADGIHETNHITDEAEILG
jgi:hypothetical protein